MAEKSFKSPGFFEQEIELTVQKQSPSGNPAGIIGTAQSGPAFVPVTIGTFEDFQNRFGGLHPDRFGPYAVREFLKNRNAVTYMRVLGAGANESSADISNTKEYGIVKNAGFILSGSNTKIDGRHPGAVQFLVAQHTIPGAADIGYPLFTDNESFPSVRESGGTFSADSGICLVRAVIFTPTGSLMTIQDYNYDIEGAANINAANDLATADSTNYGVKLVLRNGESSEFGNSDGKGSSSVGVKVFSASLDPDNVNYIGKVLNTDPKLFQQEQHLLYLDFPIETSVATPSTTSNHIALLSGSANASSAVGTSIIADNSYAAIFGRFDTRYQAPKTTKFISQPFGATELDLFHFELLSDGSNANSLYKISISNVKASTDPNYKYGTFNVELRKWDDLDQSPEILEQYTACSMDPGNDRFVAKVIGDKKVIYNFDSENQDERRLVVSGRYPNKSLRMRIVMDEAVYKGTLPDEALPFGFKGIPTIQTSPNTKQAPGSFDEENTYGTAVTSGTTRLVEYSDTETDLTGSIVPPIPFRFKVTKGALESSNVHYTGYPGSKERIDGRLYWGIKFENVGSSVYTSNASNRPNNLIKSYTKFQGIQKVGSLYSDSDANSFGSNKFTLARVALGNTLSGTGHISDITGSASQHMLEAAYIRNGSVKSSDYTVRDVVSGTDRITLATLLNSSSVHFNRFSSYAKFNNIFFGGFDGLNILNRDINNMTDKAASTDSAAGGLGGDSITGGIGLYGTNNGSAMGKGKLNNVIASYRQAINVMTDPLSVKTNILAIPGIRDPYVTDHAAEKSLEYAMGFYIMDIPSYDEDGNRIFIDDTSKVPDVDKTAEELEGRVFDNNYAATYFPDVFISDPQNNRRVLVPPSVAAIGALGYTDSVAYPWFAPAGFNRGSLGFVQNVKVRLSTQDRDTLYESRINPISTFPNGGFVIFGQKTLQLAQSALDRVNVRRLMLEVKRQVVDVARNLIFEQNNDQTRQRFINNASPKLALIQSQAGIESFKIIMDNSNNTDADKEENRLNGKIIVVPTRAIEFISIDFVITNSGVAFE